MSILIAPAVRGVRYAVCRYRHSMTHAWMRMKRTVGPMVFRIMHNAFGFSEHEKTADTFGFFKLEFFHAGRT
jgi:hypothetical protein